MRNKPTQRGFSTAETVIAAIILLALGAAGTAVVSALAGDAPSPGTTQPAAR